MAGVITSVGALWAPAVATTVGKGIIPPELSTQALVISALIAAITWNLLTWYYGVPSSSSHALIFSLVGAGVASAGWGSIQFGGLEKTFQGLVFSPILGFGAAFLVMVLLLNLFVHAYPATVTRIFGRAQVLSAAWMAFSHGSNDAQKTMGVMTMALASYLHWGGSQWEGALWIIVGPALAVGLGTPLRGRGVLSHVGLLGVPARPGPPVCAPTPAAAS